jgi:hypothetical protein
MDGRTSDPRQRSGLLLPSNRALLQPGSTENAPRQHTHHGPLTSAPTRERGAPYWAAPRAPILRLKRRHDWAPELMLGLGRPQGRPITIRQEWFERPNKSRTKASSGS